MAQPLPSKSTPVPALLFALWWLCSCAAAPTKRPAGDPSLPEIDVLQLKENSDEALKLSQENKLEMQSLQAKMREIEARVSALGDEVATLPLAKLDELSQQLGLITAQLRNLEDRLARAPAAAPGKLSTFSPSALDTPSTNSAGAGAKAPSAKASKGAAAKPALTKPGASDVESGMYKKAFDLFYGRDYARAAEKFEELLVKFPSGTYADNCHYWIGECHFASGNFAKAIASFRKVLGFGESEKSDDAQLKLGYCQLRLGDRKLAAEEFKKVVSLYPESEYTERAKEELAKLE